MTSVTARHLNNIHSLYDRIKPFQAYLGIILLRLTFDIVYLFIINPVYGYSGFLLDFVAYKYVLSWLVTLGMTPFIVNLYNNSSVSSTIILLINLIYFIPGCTLYSMAGLPDSYFLFYGLYWIILMIWQYKIPYIHFRLPPEKLSRLVFYAIIVLIGLGAIAISGMYNGFQMNFRLDNVYELRMQQRSLGLLSLVGYFQPLASIFLPLVLVYFLAKKRYLLSLVALIIQMLLFSFGGMKFTLLLVPVALCGFYLYREKRMDWFSWGMVAFNFMALFEYLLRKSYWITAYFQNRSIMLTNLISYQYYDFFSTHTPDYLFQGILRRLGFLSQYDIQIPYIIGFNYYGNIANRANNGLVGDAFSNFAWLGLIVFPLFIILALRLMDACAHGLDRRLLITVFAGYAFLFTNGSFFTIMLTNGFIFMCAALFFMPRTGRIMNTAGKPL
ncbi:MAG: hypothetical protein GXY50_06555 [Syntrophomonadaceae bacterium]|nr:hypothetical protein [Syntrophomonadaceae bacterium]